VYLVACLTCKDDPRCVYTKRAVAVAVSVVQGRKEQPSISTCPKITRGKCL
jgi:hypothetical protein